MRSKAPYLGIKASSLVVRPLSPCTVCLTRTFSSKRRGDDDDEVYAKVKSSAMSITQGPFGWIAKTVNLWLLKAFYDRQFDEKEFLRGAKQALCVVSDLLNKESYGDLEGILSDELTSSIRNGRDIENLGPAVTMKQIISANIQKVQLGYVQSERSHDKVIDIKVAYMFTSKKDNEGGVFEKQFGNVKIIGVPIPRMVYYTFRKFILPDSASNWQVRYISYTQSISFSDL